MNILKTKPDVIVGAVIYICLAFIFPDSNLFVDHTTLLKIIIALPVWVAVDLFITHLIKDSSRIKKQIDK